MIICTVLFLIGLGARLLVLKRGPNHDLPLWVQSLWVQSASKTGYLHFTLHHQAGCSFQGHLNFSGKHSAMLQLHEDYSFTFPSLSVAMYSFIQLSELWQRGVIKLAKGSKQPQWDLKPGSLD